MMIYSDFQIACTLLSMVLFVLAGFSFGAAVIAEDDTWGKVSATTLLAAFVFWAVAL